MVNSGGVQSLHRALDLLEIVQQHGGQMAIGEIAGVCEIPVATIHRLLKTLVGRGYMRQLPNRRYALGSRLVPLALTATSLLGADAAPALLRLVAELGETANLALLSDQHAQYVAQVPSAHSMRMFTEVGRRVELHCTGVGKALLAQLPTAEVENIIRRVGLASKTTHTLSNRAFLLADLALIRERGYALDNEEQELGVRCIAVTVPGTLLTPMALSVSGPLTRVTEEFITRAAPLLRVVAHELGDEISRTARETASA